MNTALAILMALSAYTMLSLGFVMQKKGIDWMGWKGEKDHAFYRNLLVWVFGFIIMNIYGVPSAVALKTLPAHMVSAFAGWGIIMLVVFSSWILKEKMVRSDYFFAFLIVAGIFLLGVFERGTKQVLSGVDRLGLAIMFIVPSLLFGVMLLKIWSRQAKTAGYAAVSGMCAGLMVISLGLLVLQYGYQVALYPKSLYLYLYAFAALLSLAGLQLALKNGDMIAIGPVQYGSTIIYPVLGNLLVFHQVIHFVQLIAVVIIVFSVIKILNSRQ